MDFINHRWIRVQSLKITCLSHTVSVGQESGSSLIRLTTFFLITHEHFYCKEKKTLDEKSRTLQKLFTNLSIFIPNLSFDTIIGYIKFCLHSQDKRRGSRYPTSYRTQGLDLLWVLLVDAPWVRVPELWEMRRWWNRDHRSPGRVSKENVENNLRSTAYDELQSHPVHWRGLNTEQGGLLKQLPRIKISLP